MYIWGESSSGCVVVEWWCSWVWSWRTHWDRWSCSWRTIEFVWSCFRRLRRLWNTVCRWDWMWCPRICVFSCCCLRSRTNFAGMPLLREMYKSARSLYRSKYYGYTNSDILISGSLLVILEELLLYHSRGMLTDGVRVIEWIESSSSYRVSYLTLKFLEVFHLNRWSRTLTTSIGLNTSSSHVPFTARLGSVVNLTTRTFGSSTANSISRWLVMWWLVVVGWTTTSWD